MKYLRDDNKILSVGSGIDKNDPAGAREAVELSLPAGFSKKAQACWDYFEGAAFLFEYKDRLVMTDESLYLTDHGDGYNEPLGYPRGVFETWDEVETWLEEVYDEGIDDITE